MPEVVLTLNHSSVIIRRSALKAGEACKHRLFEQLLVISIAQVSDRTATVQIRKSRMVGRHDPGYLPPLPRREVPRYQIIERQTSRTTGDDDKEADSPCTVRGPGIRINEDLDHQRHTEES